MTATKTETPKMINENFETREGWLKAAGESIAPMFVSLGHEVPEFRVSCGWPSRGATKSNAKTIGQAWSPSCSGDDTPEIFISPVLGSEEVAEVLETLAHEMVHIVVGIECGHRGAFKRLATEIGLEGKMTATHAGDDLKAKLAEISEALGIYPHAKLTPGETKKKNKNRHHKLVCVNEECDFICRASNGPVEEFGLPWHCEKEMKSELPEDEEERPEFPTPTPDEDEEDLKLIKKITEEEGETTPLEEVIKDLNLTPIKDLTKDEAKARKAINDKESRVRRNAAKAKAEEDRLAKLSDTPFTPDLPFTFFNELRNGKKGSQVEATEHTLLRYVDGARFQFSEDGGAMWLEGTA